MYIDKSILTPNKELKAMARQQLKGNWGKVVLACFLFFIISGLPGAIPVVGIIVSILIAGPFTFGLYGYFLKFTRGENPQIENLFDGFKFFAPTFVLLLLIGIFTFLWSLLLVIPGIIAALSYSMAFYILYDNPGMSAIEALRRSKEMMKGQKGKLFLLGLSFIGWVLLCIFTFGIGALWLTPYMYTSLTNFYNDLKNASGEQPLAEPQVIIE